MVASFFLTTHIYMGEFENLCYTNVNIGTDNKYVIICDTKMFSD